MYAFMVHLNGAWVWTIIDDYLPVNVVGRPLYSGSVRKPHAMYVLLQAHQVWMFLLFFLVSNS